MKLGNLKRSTFSPVPTEEVRQLLVFKHVDAHFKELDAKMEKENKSFDRTLIGVICFIAFIFIIMYGVMLVGGAHH